MPRFPVAFVVFLAVAVSAQSTTKSPSTSSTTKPAAASHPTAIIDTTAGKLTCSLFPDKAPIGVANFVGLAKGTKDWTNPATGRLMHGVPLYNGTIFHRVIPEFMIQGGSPSGRGEGDPGYKFKNETSSDLLFDRPGRLAYANAGPDTNGSQFFVTEAPTPFLDGKYTIFGQCDEPSVELVKKIARMPRDQNPGPDQDRPYAPPKITKITIVGSGGTVHHVPVQKPAAKPGTSTAK